MKKRLAILISGHGSNMEAIVAAAGSPGYPAEAVLVISDNEAARGLKTATDNGISAKAIVRDNYPSRAEHEQAVAKAVKSSKADLVCLAGYMRLLSADFVREFDGRLINIHPSLLPAYKGLNTHARVLADGAEIHGCTVHFVNAEMDGGAIIAQAKVPVLPGDSEERLAARVLEAEHLLYPQVVRWLAENKVRLQNGEVILDPDLDDSIAGGLLSI